MPNFEILVYILIIHWKEAVLYFTLSCIAGLLIFCSCVLGDYLSKSLSRTPRHRHRSHSIRSRRSMGNGDMTLLHGPGPPQKLGSWNTQRAPVTPLVPHQYKEQLVRPSSLSLEHISDTLPSPWPLPKQPEKFGKQDKPRPFSHTMTMDRMRSEDEESNYNYPWVFYDPHTQENRRVFYTQALYKKENINVV